MRAVVIREFGPPKVLEAADADEVRAGPGEVIIDVGLANVTFVETQVRAGRPPHPSMLPALPAILGNGVGGTVAGQQVIASLNGTGGYAERAVCPAARLIEVPDGVALRDAVALLADGRTAFGLTRRASLRPGDTVLVEAAGGGVGTLLVQLARNAGARVVGAARGERKLDAVRALGADLTVDYGDADWADRVRDAVGTVDVVLDGVGGDIGMAAFGLLGAGGRFCPFGMASGKFTPVTPELAGSRQVTVLTGGAANPEEMTALTREALAEAAAGRIRPVIGQEFELAAAADAHAAIEARATIGKTLLTVSLSGGGHGWAALSKQVQLCGKISNMTSMSLPAQIIRTWRFTAGVPGEFTVALGGAAVLFLRGRTGDDLGKCLWAVDLDSGAERLLADPAELLGSSAVPGTGIDGYATDQAAGRVAFALGGGLWTVEVTGGQVRRLPAEGPVADPRPDPGGRRIAYVSRGALRIIEADGTGGRAIMTPDGPDVTVGIAEGAGAVTLGGSCGYWWAPDGGRLLVARVDSAAVGLWHIADPAEPGRAPRTVRYPAAGTANAEATLWIAGLDGSRIEVRWDRNAFEYVPAAGWDAHGPYALVQSRNQRTVRFLGIDPDDGETRVLSEQRDERWVQLIPGLPARTGSGALIEHADLRGTRHLTVGGAVVTPPGLQLRALLGVDGDEVLFSASREPTETHLWSYRAADGIRRLSAEPGVHDGLLRDGTLVHVGRGSDRPGGRAEVRREGKPPVSIASLAERPVLGVRATRLALGPRELRARLYLPSWYGPDHGPLPVLADPYGGAGMQRVTAELEWRGLVSQWFAEQGFAVLVADGSGTPGRGPDWERKVHGDLFGPVLEDQVTALHEAARRHPELDLGRVGIRGWSFSGSLAAMAVLRRPDVFHVAVAGAGTTDQRLYNTHWRERSLGHPDEFPERYEAASLVLAAPKLTRPLLLIHGLADDNVFPAHTLRLSSALLAAGRPHEILLLPGAPHQPMGGPITENLLWHQVRFLKRHLGAATLVR